LNVKVDLVESIFVFFNAGQCVVKGGFAGAGIALSVIIFKVAAFISNQHVSLFKEFFNLSYLLFIGLDVLPSRAFFGWFYISLWK